MKYRLNIRRYYFIRIISLSILLFLLFSCQKSNRKIENVFKIGISDELNTFDYTANTLVNIKNVHKLVFEPLYGVHPLDSQGEVYPLIAKSLPKLSEDKFTETYEIRRNIFYHDNSAFDGKKREVKVDDFILTLKRMADPNNNNQFWSNIKDKIVGIKEWREKQKRKKKTDFRDEISGVQKINDYKFSIKKTSKTYLYKLLSEVAYSPTPEEVFLKHEKNMGEIAVGTGPFILKDNRNQLKKIFIKNDFYWAKNQKLILKNVNGIEDLNLDGDFPFVDKIEITFFKEERTEMLNFEKGNIDISAGSSESLSYSNLNHIELNNEYKKKKVQVIQNPIYQTCYIGINLDRPLMRNKKLRMAFNYGHDNERAIRISRGIEALPSKSLIPPELQDDKGTYEFDFAKYDFEKAKRLLAEAGYPKGKGLPEFIMNVPSYKFTRDPAEFFRIDMEKLGIRIKTNVMPFREVMKLTKDNDYDLSFVGRAHFSLYYWLKNFKETQIPAATNPSHFRNSKFDQIMSSYERLETKEEKKAAMKKAFEIFGNEVPIIPIYHSTGYTLLQRHVTNYAKGNFKFIRFKKNR